MRSSSGQAEVELIAAVPALLLAGLICLQLLAAGLTLTLADGAAEAGALALAAGADPAVAAREALPGVARGRIEVRASGGRVEVRVEPRALIPGTGSALAVASTARVREGS